MLGKDLTIIGGAGGMGQVFGSYFKNYGFNVTLNARNEEILRKVANNLGVKYEISLEKSVKEADIVMISIPIKSTPDMIRKVAPFMKEDAILFDVTSLKNEVYKAFKEVSDIYPINCISLHPMFGPGITNLKNYVIIYLRVGGTENYDNYIDELLTLFRKDGVILTETTPEIHDLRIALTLGVPHMLNIIFLKLLKSSDESLKELTNYTGTTFLLQKVFAESIIQREMEMFSDIQMENQEFHKVIDLFENLVSQYKDIIKNKNKTEFFKIFTEGLEYSKEDTHFLDSYEYFYEFMKILKNENKK
ncbi:MAG: prephenate dehydrogenase/arogenate dehydrogenase family protein [Candidatus Hodarchaeota archaeon]